MQNLLIVIFIGLVAAFVAVLMYRRLSVAVWAFIAGVLPDSPYLFSLFGVTSLENLILVSRTLGLFFYPVILVIIDVLLIEISLLKLLYPFEKMIKNRSIRLGLTVNKILDKLQKYYTMPRPERILWVYMIGVMSGVINLIVNIAIFYIILA